MWIVLLLISASNANPDIREVGVVSVTHPGHLEKYEHSHWLDEKERFSLIVACFSPVVDVVDDVYLFRHPSEHFEHSGEVQLETLATGLLWPNEPEQIPEAVFGFKDALSVPTGFVASDTYSPIVLIDMRTPTDIRITDVTSGSNIGSPYSWFYHRVFWMDADGDGYMDLFTCRARLEPATRVFYSSFLWYKNPGGSDPINTDSWEIGLEISENDCDTFMVEGTFTVGVNQTYDAVFTTGYFSYNLSVYWSEHPDGLWNDNSQIFKRVIDTVVEDLDCEDESETCGNFFEVFLDDLNNDGKQDLLVSINSEIRGLLVAYEIPDDFRSGDYIKHEIARDFVPELAGQNTGAPGQSLTFYPSTDTLGKPWILLSGDDDGSAYYLNPTSQDPNIWTYNTTKFLDLGNDHIVGKPAVFDANADGFIEVFLPLWSKNEVRCYTFGPAPENLAVGFFPKDKVVVLLFACFTVGIYLRF